MKYLANISLPYNSLTTVSTMVAKGVEQFITHFSARQNEILKTMYNSLRSIRIFEIFSEVDERALNILRNNNVDFFTLTKYLSNVMVASEKHSLTIASISLKYSRDVEIPEWEEATLVIKVRCREMKNLFNFWTEISKSKKGALRTLRVEVEPIE